MIYYILLFTIVVFLAYIAGITIVSVIDTHLQNISINLPKNNIVVNIPNNLTENFKNIKIDTDDNSDDDNDDNTNNSNTNNSNTNNSEINEETMEGFENNGDFYMIDDIKMEKDVLTCQINHVHTNCINGRMNYPEPQTMSPLDKRYFKYNYQNNLTVQDYINWLWLYENTEEELPYIHLKNLYKLKKGEKLYYNNGILPPMINTKIPKNTAEYFNKIYNDGEININCPLDTNEECYNGFNYNQYPNIYNK